MQLYALEGFLARLTVSPFADQLVLKGGVLMAAFDARRPTRDVDLQAQSMSNGVDEVLSVACAIAAIKLEDGLDFDTESAAADTIRDEDTYSGVRVTIPGSLATARLTLHVDLNVGDPVHPAPERVALPRLLDGPPIELIGYPLPMVLAEKIVTAVERGEANTRWRDFADIYLIAGQHTIKASDLTDAITTVAAYRDVVVAPLRGSLPRYAELAQSRWAAWRRRQRLDALLPTRFADVLETATALADPILSDANTGAEWHPAAREWR
ncbi:MAG: nucleotidyl transferase AbiEii/AbiGii toxin family protein [Pseudonocardiaceae bacterium]|nr:nucleotidyl transferase AbiEii/AbiGii toxin family protein [Pseudonocardiaceae bacterium]